MPTKKSITQANLGDKPARKSATKWRVLPGSPEWTEAQQACEAHCKREIVPSADVEDLVNEALYAASPKWRGEAKFSTYVVKIMRNALTKRGQKIARAAATTHVVDELSSSEDSDQGRCPMPKLKPGQKVAYARALADFLEQEAMMVEALMFGENSRKLAEYLRVTLGADGARFQFSMRSRGLPTWPTTAPRCAPSARRRA